MSFGFGMLIVNVNKYIDKFPSREMVERELETFLIPLIVFSALPRLGRRFAPLASFRFLRVECHRSS